MMCAFMMPVVKNDWEVYQTRRSRNNSEGSQVSGGGLPPPPSRSAAHVRKKAIGASGRSMSYHAPSNAMQHDLLYARSPPKAYHLSTRNSRNASRVSMNTGIPTDTNSHNQSSTSPKQSGPRKSPSAVSLNKFHNKVMDKLRSVLHMKDQETEDSESPAKDSRGQS